MLQSFPNITPRKALLYVPAHGQIRFAERGVETKIYRPVPVYRSQIYWPMQDCLLERVMGASEGLNLPIRLCLTEEDVQKIVAEIQKAIP